MGHTLRFEDGCVSRAQARRLRVNVDLIRRMRQARERERCGEACVDDSGYRACTHKETEDHESHR
jgi:hypothetical protein